MQITIYPSNTNVTNGLLIKTFVSRNRFVREELATWWIEGNIVVAVVVVAVIVVVTGDMSIIV